MSFSIKQLKELISNIKDVDYPEDKIIFKKSDSYNIAHSYTSKFSPHYKDIDTIATLSRLVNLGYNNQYSDTQVTEVLHRQLVDRYNYFGEPLAAIDRYVNKDVNHDVYYSEESQVLRDKTYLYKLRSAPVEFTEGDVTYRLIGKCNRYDFNMPLMFCEPSTSARYNYMDKDMFMLAYNSKEDDVTRYFFSKALDGATWRVLFLLTKLPSSANTVLQDGCFLNAKTANVVVMSLTKRLGMSDATQLTQLNAGSYLAFDNMIKKHWLASAENRLFAEFVEGKRESVVKSGVTFTKDLASYEKLSFGFPEIIKRLQDCGAHMFSFEREFDIYKIANVLAQRWTFNTREHWSFVINGMPVNLAVTASSRYQINEHTVLKEELVELVNQAFCFTDVAEYNKLLAGVSKMSLLVHNAWSCGMNLRWRKLPEKQPDNGYAFFERDMLDKWKNNPRLRFKKDGNKYYLYTGESDENKVQIPYFVGFVRGVHNINKVTNWNNHYSITGTYQSAEQRLITLLVEKTKTKARSVKNEDGTTTETGGVATMTAEEAKAVLYAADTVTAKAIAKSKQFLDSVVVAVGAEEATLRDMKGYKVKGAKHTYFVETATNRAHSFETGQYICIVDSNHGVRLGYDELATRLMVLANDARTVSKISTLSQYVK